MKLEHIALIGVGVLALTQLSKATPVGGNVTTVQPIVATPTPDPPITNAPDAGPALSGIRARIAELTTLKQAAYTERVAMERYFKKIRLGIRGPTAKFSEPTREYYYQVKSSGTAYAREINKLEALIHGY